MILMGDLMKQPFSIEISNNMTDREIVSFLIAREPKVTAQFFFKDCHKASVWDADC